MQVENLYFEPRENKIVQILRKEIAMIKRRKNIQTVALAVGLLLMSGIGIGYNIYTAEDEGLSISVARLAEGWFETEYTADAISKYSRGNLEEEKGIPVFSDGGLDRGYELLPPIVTR